jgi:signal transduction histidine kinase
VISASQTDQDVCISVRDNGAGIERAEHQRIFQKFYRVDDRLARERDGSGLGLAIVDHIVRAHGGQVGLESAPGRGSTFSIILPTQVLQKDAPAKSP